MSIAVYRLPVTNKSEREQGEIPEAWAQRYTANFSEVTDSHVMEEIKMLTRLTYMFSLYEILLLLLECLYTRLKRKIDAL